MTLRTPCCDRKVKDATLNLSYDWVYRTCPRCGVRYEVKLRKRSEMRRTDATWREA
jgi:hypothetical protein